MKKICVYNMVLIFNSILDKYQSEVTALHDEKLKTEVSTYKYFRTYE